MYTYENKSVSCVRSHKTHAVKSEKVYFSLRMKCTSQVGGGPGGIGGLPIGGIGGLGGGGGAAPHPGGGGLHPPGIGGPGGGGGSQPTAAL